MTLVTGMNKTSTLGMICSKIEQMVAEALREFVTIVDRGSVSQAARDLGLPRPTLSRHLSALEDQLGVTLLHRETRRLTLTRAGEELYRRALKIVSDAAELEVAVRELDGVPRGTLRVSLPPAIGVRGAELVHMYLEANPNVSVDIVSSIRHVDLVGEGIDVALRGGVVRDPSLMARQLFPSSMRVVAAPTLLERVGPIRTLADLDRLPCVLVYQGGWKPVDDYPLLDGGSVRVRGRIRSNDLELVRTLVMKGVTAALLPTEYTASEQKRGALVAVLPDVIGAKSALSVVWPRQDHLDPKVRAFIDASVAYFSRWPAGERFAESEGGE